MGPLGVIVLDEVVDRASKCALAEEDEVVEALFLNRSHEAFGVGVCLGCRMHPMGRVTREPF